MLRAPGQGQCPLASHLVTTASAPNTHTRPFPLPHPQLYVRGELLGGCDIVLDMKAGGELGSTIGEMLHRMDVAA